MNWICFIVILFAFHTLCEITSQLQSGKKGEKTILSPCQNHPATAGEHKVVTYSFTKAYCVVCLVPVWIIAMSTDALFGASLQTWIISL